MTGWLVAAVRRQSCRLPHVTPVLFWSPMERGGTLPCGCRWSIGPDGWRVSRALPYFRA